MKDEKTNSAFKVMAVYFFAQQWDMLLDDVAWENEIPIDLRLTDSHQFETV